jgi:hypothetical protein
MTAQKPGRPFDAELAATAALLVAVLVIGLATVGDYAITTDEFLMDRYGPRPLAWYLSGFTDWSWLDDIEGLRVYGPWFQMLVALIQSFHLADPFDVRHALTFLVGLGGLATLLPIGRLTVGRWAGFAAIVLCLMMGNLYGQLFFSPNDLPFMAAMTWATLAILVMARSPVPSWPAAVCTGLLTGLAIATRVGGIITYVYLLGAMVLCALEVVIGGGRDRAGSLRKIGLRTAVAMLVGYITAIALWPWLQSWDSFARFKYAYDFFGTIDLKFDFPHWGREVSTAALPWDYIPGQFLARLPEGFVILLILALASGVAAGAVFIARCVATVRADGPVGLKTQALLVARSRGLLIIVAAVVTPVGFVTIRNTLHFDGIRHLLFIIPPLAILAAWALRHLAPLIHRFPVVSATLAGAHIGATLVLLASLHPLEYIATNAFAGGIRWSYGRFELDYWSAAATEAVRRLEDRLDYDTSGRFVSSPPRVHVCIAFREQMVAPMLRRKWIVELERQKADFIIETERSRCVDDSTAVLIDTVRRFDRAFAWTFAASPRAKERPEAE